MVKKLLFVILLLCMFSASASGAFSYGAAYYQAHPREVGNHRTATDPLYLFMNETEGYLEGTSAVDALLVTGTIGLLESTGATYYTYLQAGNQAANVTYTLPTADGSNGQVLKTNGSGVLSWTANAGTFTGGNITSDVTLADDVDILPTTTITDTFSIQVRDVDGAAYLDVLRWTNANTPTVVLGNALESLAIASTGLNVSTAGAVSGVTTLGIGGNVTLANGMILDQSSDNSWKWTENSEDIVWTFAGNAVTLSSTTGVVSLDFGSVAPTFGASVVASSGISSADDITLATGKALKSSTTTAETMKLQVYDNDTGPGYKDALTLTNGNTPSLSLGGNAMTVAVDSSDWDISTTGAMTGIGAITADGLFTGTLGATITGAAANLNASSNFAVNIASGTSTGTVTIGGAGTQQIDIGNGAAAKTVALGSDNGASATTIKAGTGDLSITSIDDVTINGGSAGSIISIGVNTQGNVIKIADDDTTADTLTIGSAKDTITVSALALNLDSGATGILLNDSVDQSTNINTGTSTGTVTIGGTGVMTIDIGAGGTGAKAITVGDGASTGRTTVQSGTGGLLFNEDINADVNMASGTSTGTVTIGGAAAQTIVIGNGAAAKTVTLGSSNTTSTTNILAGSGGINITGSVIRTSQQYIQTIGYCKVGSTAGWVVPAAADAAHVASLPQSQTASTLVIPITIPLKVGCTITAWTLNGQIDSAGNTATLDAQLHKHTEATAGFANVGVGSGMAQLSKTADYKVADGESGLSEIVAADETFYLLITGTTAATTDVEIAGVTVTISEI